MNRFRGRIVGVFSLLAWVAAAGFVFGQSTFDAGLEGWTADGGTLAFVADGGNPAGHLQLTDATTSDMFLIAPLNPLFSGDLSGHYAGTLSFDARHVGTSGPGTPYPAFGIVTIANGANSMSLDLAPLNTSPPSEWTTYSALLHETVWGVADFDALIAILSNVTSLTVSLESHSPVVETVAFDNFILGALPEPTAGTLAAGLAAVALLRRRGRRFGHRR